MKYFFYPLFLIAMIVATACSDQDVIDAVDENIPDDQKQEITFTISDTGSKKFSRSTATRTGFATGTDIIARFESFKSTSVGSEPTSEKRSTRTILHADAQAEDKDYSLANYLSLEYRRYWDDAFGRLANLSVYAIAVPGKNNTHKNNNVELSQLLDYGGDNVSTNNTTWKKETSDKKSNNNINWTVTTSGQSISIIADEDLCYSNNIQPNGTNGRYVWNYSAPTPGYEPVLSGGNDHKNGQMRIALQNATDKTKDGHFDKGHLVFKHALTRLTINLKRGTGFESPAPFAFKNDAEGQPTNIKINSVSVSNTLNIESGIWGGNPTIGNIEKMAVLSEVPSGYSHSLRAQFIPGYVFTEGDESKHVLEYTIDDNTYYITPGILYNALTKSKDAEGHDITINAGEIETISGKHAVQMKQGKNYVINIIVNKSGIANVTASLVDWVDIDTQEVEAHNSYISLSIMDKTGLPCDNFDLYRLSDDVDDPYSTGTEPKRTNWFSRYSEKATFSPTTPVNGLWTATWFWESNKSFYHFRTVNSGIQIKQGTETSDPKDYFEVISGQLSTTNDYHWGAPMYSGASMKYDESEGYNGVDKNFIYPAIGSTTSTIHIIEHHMMSNIHIVLHTDTKENDVTTLSDNGVMLMKDEKTTIVELNRFYANGIVEMGRGLVNPTTTEDPISAQINAPDPYFITKESENNVGETNKYSYRVVPQALNRGTAPTDADKIGLTITTPDGNKYFVPDLAIINAVVGTNTQHHQASAAVTRWYPGYDYTYHIRLHKTGIEAITCTIVDWVRINTEDIEIGL